MLLRKGSRGHDVEDLQKKLNQFCGPPPKYLGFLLLKTDGKFGQNTEKSLVAFQRYAKIKVDGVCGSQSWSSLALHSSGLPKKNPSVSKPTTPQHPIVITIKRLGSDGNLTFTGGGKVISTKCYWNTKKKIPVGTYLGCSATTMARKKNSKGTPREGVFIPNIKGYSEIFIHMGKVPYEIWSDGCIVIDEPKVIEIYNAITPKNGRNVKVVITG